MSKLDHLVRNLVVKQDLSFLLCMFSYSFRGVWPMVYVENIERMQYYFKWVIGFIISLG